MLDFFLSISVKNRDDSESLPYLQANKLACHSHMAAGRRQVSSGSETKKQFKNSSTSQGISICTTSPNPNSYGKIQKSSHDNCTILETATFYSKHQEAYNLLCREALPLPFSVFCDKSILENMAQNKDRQGLH